LDLVPACEPLANSASVVSGEVVAYLPLAGLVDLDAERARVQKDLDALEGRIAGSRARLDGEFAQKAPAPVVAREREKLAEMEGEAAQVREHLSRLS
jgi:valyl-tRNA synthetase